MEQALIEMARQIAAQQAEIDRLRSRLVKKTPAQRNNEEREQKERVLGLVTRMYRSQDEKVLKDNREKIIELQERRKAVGLPPKHFGMSKEDWDEALKNFR